MSEARLVPYEHLPGVELVTVRAVLWRAGDPLAVGCLHQLAEHNNEASRDG